MKFIIVNQSHMWSNLIKFRFYTIWLSLSETVNTTHHFFKKKIELWVFDLRCCPTKWSCLKHQNLPVSNSERSQSTSAYNKIDASSIIHIYRCKLAWWRHGISTRKEKSMGVRCPSLFVPTFCLTFAALSHHEPYFSSVSARILATLRSMEVLTHLPGWTNAARWRLLDVDNRCGHVALVHQSLLVFHWCMGWIIATRAVDAMPHLVNFLKFALCLVYTD